MKISREEKIKVILDRIATQVVDPARVTPGYIVNSHKLATCLYDLFVELSGEEEAEAKLLALKGKK